MRKTRNNSCETGVDAAPARSTGCGAAKALKYYHAKKLRRRRSCGALLAGKCNVIVYGQNDEPLCQSPQGFIPKSNSLIRSTIAVHPYV